MRGRQLVKCYQVDEKLQQIRFIISWKRKLTKKKKERDGGQLISCAWLFGLRVEKEIERQEAV